MKSLDSKESPAISGMLPKFFKDISETILRALCELFNKSFFKVVFPDHMKVAMVTSICKGKFKLEVSNYRPVSVSQYLVKF